MIQTCNLTAKLGHSQEEIGEGKGDGDGVGVQLQLEIQLPEWSRCHIPRQTSTERTLSQSWTSLHQLNGMKLQLPRWRAQGCSQERSCAAPWWRDTAEPGYTGPPPAALCRHCGSVPDVWQAGYALHIDLFASYSLEGVKTSPRPPQREEGKPGCFNAHTSGPMWMLSCLHFLNNPKDFLWCLSGTSVNSRAMEKSSECWL